MYKRFSLELLEIILLTLMENIQREQCRGERSIIWGSMLLTKCEWSSDFIQKHHFPEHFQWHREQCFFWESFRHYGPLEQPKNPTYRCDSHVHALAEHIFTSQISVISAGYGTISHCSIPIFYFKGSISIFFSIRYKIYFFQKNWCTWGDNGTSRDLLSVMYSFKWFLA